MKSFFKILFAVGVMMFVGQHSASAQRVSKISGKALSGFCSQSKTVEICDAYLSGVTDSEVWAHDYAIFNHQKNTPAFCIPKEQTTQQIRNLVVAWMGAHVDALNEPAGRGIYRALHENYPCHNQVVDGKTESK